MSETIEVLMSYPAGDRESTAELVEILQLTADIHHSLECNADRYRRYGRCVTCEQWWPCPSFELARYAATEWLARAANAIARRRGLIGPALPVVGKPALPDMTMLECYWCGGDCRGVDSVELTRLSAVNELMKNEAVHDARISRNGTVGK